jgi:hypothetical protein
MLPMRALANVALSSIPTFGIFIIADDAGNP